MSAHTPVCELLGIEHPIVEAPLSADPRLPAAVSNAGALGSVALWWADDAGDLVRETAALTDRPFAGNFVLTSDQHRRVDQALSAGLRIVSFLLGDPRSYVETVHDAGGLVLHTVGSAEEARRAVGCGVDIVIAQGWEAGGHVWGGVATLPLVPAVVDAVAPVPVIAAGGIGDARGVAAVLALGAQAAWLGTRFLLAEEMPIHEEYRRRLIAATETDAEWYPNLYERGMAGLPPPRHPQLDRRDVGGRGPAAAGQSTGRRRGDSALRLGRTDRSILPRAPDGRDDRRDRGAVAVGRTERRARQDSDSPLRRSWPNSSRACSVPAGAAPALGRTIARGSAARRAETCG